MKRPVSLTIVGATWFLIGLFGVVNEGINTHGLAIPGNNFINLLVGVGLLKGWQICRWYALFVTGITFVFMLPFAPWAMLNAGRLAIHFPALMIDNRPHETTSLIVVVLVLVSYLVLSGWVFLVLRRPIVRDFFAPRAAVTV